MREIGFQPVLFEDVGMPRTAYKTGEKTIAIARSAAAIFSWLLSGGKYERNQRIKSIRLAMN